MKVSKIFNQVIDYINSRKWLSWLVVIFGAFFVSFISYMIFRSRDGAPAENLYQSASGRGSELSKLAKTFIGGIDTTVINVVSWVLVALIIGFAIYLLAKKKMKWRYAFLIIFTLGALVRIAYACSTDNIFTRQYDVWSNYYTGHYSITMHIYTDWHLPELRNGSLDSSYQMYHPKFSHYTYAIIMHINSLFFGKDRPDFVLYESIRIFTSGLMIINMYVGYLIFKESFKNNVAIFVGTAFVVFAPQLIRFAASSNNDTMLYFFLFLSVLFAVRFYKRDGWVNILLCAFSIGMAMGSKLSGALIAVPVDIFFIYKFVRLFFDYKDKEMWRKVLMLLAYYSAFLLICAPIGLFWPIYNLKNYNQPFTYVFHNLNKGLLIPEDYTFADRYLYFSFETFFASMFRQGWNTGKYVVDYNMYTNMLKTSLFGEFSYEDPLLFFCSILYVTGYLMLFGSIVLMLYFTFIKCKKKEFDYPVMFTLPIFAYFMIVFFKAKATWGYVLSALFFILVIFELYYAIKNYKRFHERHLTIIFNLIIFTAFIISFFTFQVEYPYTCSSDFRYVVIFLIPGGYALGKLFENKRINKNILSSIAILLSLYYFGAIALNISL